jgi:SAM-dependent methyltransferase
MLNKLRNRIAKIFGRSNEISAKENWKNYQPDPNKSHQENAGYSHIKDVQECIDKTHVLLKDTVNKYLGNNNSSILDIGCGPGLYLNDFSAQHQLFGIDVNKNMLALAKQNVPRANLFHGDFLENKFEMKFEFIYSVGVIQYIPQDEINEFFNKVADLLNTERYVFVAIHMHYRKTMRHRIPSFTILQLLNGLIAKDLNYSNTFDDRITHYRNPINSTF